MKRLVTALLLAAGAFALPSYAEAPGADWISRQQVAGILTQEGYQLTKVEADDGHWEGEATKGGVTYEFHVDPHSGRVTKLEQDKD
jgi:hypothetical protein